MLTTVTVMVETVDISYVPYAQQADLLCWAASTQIVVDVLHHPLEQFKIAAYAWVAPTPVAAFNSRVATCHDNIQACNCAFTPVLDKLGFTYLKSSALTPPVLTAELIVADIKAGRPIIFGWQYTKDIRESAHFMVITGYSGDVHAPDDLQLRIFDPLPAGQGSAQYISLKNYSVKTPVELQNDMGRPHELWESYYLIQMPSDPAPTPPLTSAGLSVPGPPGGAPAPRPAPPLRESPGMDPRLAIEASRSAAVSEVARRVSAAHIKLGAGFPFPIIALGLQELRAATEPQSVLALLRRNTGTLLYPIETEGRVRDSFLMIKRGDEWIAGGYANTTVTRRLVWQRNQYAKTPAERAEHYLLSVPALGAFFLARGTGADARLIPIAHDRSIRIGEDSVQPNRPYRADQLLPALATAARRALSSPYSERGPG